MNAAFPGLHHLRFPGESADYRAARNALLADEMERRRGIERATWDRRQHRDRHWPAETYCVDRRNGLELASGCERPIDSGCEIP
jgi:predicted dithiol-disulfide oxidoreductase (DUF899 family)